jgi:hypothetical protein
MATRKPDPSRGFSNDEVAKILELICKAADSVEIKLAVPMSAHRATVQSLGLDPWRPSRGRYSSSTRPSLP